MYAPGNFLVSYNHRMVVVGIFSEDHLVQLPAKAGLPRADCTGLCPGQCWMMPEKKIPQRLWAACSRLKVKKFFLMLGWDFLCSILCLLPPYHDKCEKSVVLLFLVCFCHGKINASGMHRSQRKWHCAVGRDTQVLHQLEKGRGGWTDIWTTTQKRKNVPFPNHCPWYKADLCNSFKYLCT